MSEAVGSLDVGLEKGDGVNCYGERWDVGLHFIRPIYSAQPCALLNTRHVADAVFVSVIGDAALQVDDKLEARNRAGRG